MMFFYPVNYHFVVPFIVSVPIVFIADWVVDDGVYYLLHASAVERLPTINTTTTTMATIILPSIVRLLSPWLSSACCAVVAVVVVIVHSYFVNHYVTL